MKKTLAILLAVVMAITLFTACGDKPAPTPDSKTGSVYYLNFKPEADKAWQDLAKLYTEKTGVPVTVLLDGRRGDRAHRPRPGYRRPDSGP